MACHSSIQIACVVLWIPALIRGQRSLAFFSTLILKLKRDCFMSSCAHATRELDTIPCVNINYYSDGVGSRHCCQYHTYCTDHKLSIKLFNTNAHITVYTVILRCVSLFLLVCIVSSLMETKFACSTTLFFGTTVYLSKA